MIQDISPHNLDTLFLANRKIENDDIIFSFKENALLFRKRDGRLELPRKKELNGVSDETDKTFLFTLDSVPCYLIWDEIQTENTGFDYLNLNFFRDTTQQEIAWASLVAFHLKNWYLKNTYCGECGTKTVQKSDERAIICPNCNNTVFPRIAPAVIAAIVCGDKILLARGVNFPGRWYSLLAGYVDIGESLEEALIREVKEEVGINIWNIRYYKSQPWPLSGSLMIGFIAEADATQPLEIDAKEIADAEWYTRGELPEHALKLSIAGEMIEKFERGELG